MTTTPTLAPPSRALLTTHGQATIDLLERVESERGHDLWAEVVGSPDVQRWECQRCPAVFVRRFTDGAVGGTALSTQCPGPAELARAGRDGRRPDRNPGLTLRPLTAPF